jgi:hypothetical protein
MDSTLFKIRKYQATDRAYIARSIGHSWLACGENKDRSLASLNKKIDFMLDKCITKVVCLTEDENNIVAFIIVQPVQDVAIIHALFVRAYFRRLGIAKDLLKMLKTRYSVVARSMNYCDDDKLLKTAQELFSTVIDKTNAWKADRS